MAKTPIPNPNIQYFDNSGNPLVGGLLYTYIAGTTTPQATYTDETGGTPNTNPVVLDSAGRANVWLTPGQSYRLDLYTAGSVLVWTVDNIPGGSTAGTSTVLANTVYAGPTSGSPASPAFRALVAADIPSIGSLYADVALDNLGTTSLNAALLAQTGIDLGSVSKAFRFIYLWGAGTFATTSIRLGGTPTGARQWTFQDSTDVVVGRATTDTLTNKTLTAPAISAPVITGLASIAGIKSPLVAITTNGAIDPHTAASYVITKAGVAGMTLGAPTATTDDGLILVITSNTAFAHTITATGLLQTGATTVNVATLAAFAGASVTLIAYQGKWNVLFQNQVTFS